MADGGSGSEQAYNMGGYLGTSQQASNDSQINETTTTPASKKKKKKKNSKSVQNKVIASENNVGRLDDVSRTDVDHPDANASRKVKSCEKDGAVSCDTVRCHCSEVSPVPDGVIEPEISSKRSTGKKDTPRKKKETRTGLISGEKVEVETMTNQCSSQEEKAYERNVVDRTPVENAVGNRNVPMRRTEKIHGLDALEKGSELTDSMDSACKSDVTEKCVKFPVRDATCEREVVYKEAAVDEERVGVSLFSSEVSVCDTELVGGNINAPPTNTEPAVTKYKKKRRNRKKHMDSNSSEHADPNCTSVESVTGQLSNINLTSLTVAETRAEVDTDPIQNRVHLATTTTTTNDDDIDGTQLSSPDKRMADDCEADGTPSAVTTAHKKRKRKKNKKIPDNLDSSTHEGSDNTVFQNPDVERSILIGTDTSELARDGGASKTDLHNGIIDIAGNCQITEQSSGGTDIKKKRKQKKKRSSLNLNSVHECVDNCHLQSTVANVLETSVLLDNIEIVEAGENNAELVSNVHNTGDTHQITKVPPTIIDSQKKPKQKEMKSVAVSENAVHEYLDNSDLASMAGAVSETNVLVVDVPNEKTDDKDLNHSGLPSEIQHTIDNLKRTEVSSVVTDIKKKRKQKKKTSSVKTDTSVNEFGDTNNDSSTIGAVSESSVLVGDTSTVPTETIYAASSEFPEVVHHLGDDCEIPSVVIDSKKKRKRRKNRCTTDGENVVRESPDSTDRHIGVITDAEGKTPIGVASETVLNVDAGNSELLSEVNKTYDAGMADVPSLTVDDKKKRKRNENAVVKPKELVHGFVGDTKFQSTADSSRGSSSVDVENAVGTGVALQVENVDSIRDAVVEVEATYVENCSAIEEAASAEVTVENDSLIEGHDQMQDTVDFQTNDVKYLSAMLESVVKSSQQQLPQLRLSPHPAGGGDGADGESCNTLHTGGAEAEADVCEDSDPARPCVPDEHQLSEDEDGGGASAESECRNVVSGEGDTESGDNAASDTGKTSASEPVVAAAATASIQKRVELTWRRSKRRISWRDAVCLPTKALTKKMIQQDSGADWVPPPEVVSRLAQHGIVYIEKSNRNNTKAKYFCCCCNHGLRSLSQFPRHTGLQSHLNSILSIRDKALWLLPGPPQHHVSSLSDLISSMYREGGLTEHKRSLRESIICEVRDFIVVGLCQKLPEIECSVGVQGSWHHGCGLHSDSIDLSLSVSSDSVVDISCEEHIFTVFSTLSAESCKFSDVEVCDELEPLQLKWTHTRSRLNFTLTPESRSHARLSRLFAEYSLLDPRLAPLAAALKCFAQECGVDRTDRGYISPACFLVCVIHFLQQTSPPVLPVLHEMKSQLNTDDDSVEYMPGGEACTLWKSSNETSLGALWLQLLQFLVRTAFDDSVEYVVTIRQHAQPQPDDRVYSHRKLAIEDPFQPERNMARTVSCLSSVHYLLNCLRTAFLYFSTPGGAVSPPLCQVFSIVSAPANGGGSEPRCQTMQLTEDVSSIWRDGESAVSKYQHVIDAKVMGLDKKAPQYCSCCFGLNHSEANCPTMAVKTPEPLPDLTDQHIELLTQLSLQVFKENRPSEQCIAIRDRIVNDLELWLRRWFPTAKLQLFGSSLNGFGSATADLDICLTFSDVDDPEKLDVCSIVKKLAGCLSGLPQLSSILPITTAKVPIVKFSHRSLQVDGDISVYNTLALHNTQLLKTYAAVDNRVRVLGYFVKFLAKQCEICDRSTGGLSSYGFILLLIYFLQRTEPPILPVLQDLAPEPVVVQGRHVQFFMFSRRSQLAEVWPLLGANTEPIGQLCVELLRFYTERFDFAKHVVCVRQLEPLTKVQKGWQASSIAIEDPFLLEHNLAGGISKKMSVYIRRCFVQWRKLYGNTPTFRPPLSLTAVQYLLSADRLRGADPPRITVFRCWVCGSRCHNSKQCPKHKSNPTNAAQSQSGSEGPSRDTQSRIQLPAGMLLNPSGMPRGKSDRSAGGRRANTDGINTATFYNSNWRSRPVHNVRTLTDYPTNPGSQPSNHQAYPAGIARPRFPGAVQQYPRLLQRQQQQYQYPPGLPRQFSPSAAQRYPASLPHPPFPGGPSAQARYRAGFS